MSDSEAAEQTPRFITITIYRKDGPPIVYQEPNDDRSLYWEPFGNLREWLRDECVRFNAHPLLAQSAPRFSWAWDTTEFSVTYHGKDRSYTVDLLYSHEHRGFCYGMENDDGLPLEQYVALKDGFGAFVSPDGQVLTLEEVGQRVLRVLFNATNKNTARTETRPVC